MKGHSPGVDEVDFVNACEEHVASKGGTLSDFSPLLVAQVLWVHTHHLPSNALLYLDC